ncbi:MAG: MBL fold metallo-hydrolase [Candidatus Methylacidiphilales bacterium]
MKIKLWGTRGSTPTPSTQEFQTSRYGGDTTCVSIESGDHLTIIDGGSGLRLLGLHLLHHHTEPINANFFFSHVHWDHIQGFPFFSPGFNPNNQFRLHGPRLISSPGFVGSILEKALRGQQENLNFPVQLRDMPAQMEFHDLLEGSETLIKGGSHELLIRSFPLNHPGGCFGYRVEEQVKGKTRAVFAFATDTEHLEDLNPNVQALTRNADLVLYDSQYTPEEYDGVNGHFSHRGWGHSTWQMALKEGHAAGAKHILLHHHDPMHDDHMVAQMEARAIEASSSMNLTVQAAAQFMTFEI